jgi:hypothetical protein
MKTDTVYTDSQIDDFLNRADFEIIIEIHEDNMLGDNISFSEFLTRYQPKHLAKYKSELEILT